MALTNFLITCGGIPAASQFHACKHSSKMVRSIAMHTHGVHHALESADQLDHVARVLYTACSQANLLQEKAPRWLQSERCGSMAPCMLVLDCACWPVRLSC